MLYLIRDKDTTEPVALVAADGAREAIAKARKLMTAAPKVISAAPDHGGVYLPHWSPGDSIVTF